MNNKELVIAIANSCNLNTVLTQQRINSLIAIIVEELQEGNSVAIQGFGTFMLNKKKERIVVNPTTHLRLLIPPKLTLSYKPSNSLKEQTK